VPKVRRVHLHPNGPALWPEHASAEDSRATREITPVHIWDTTFQLRATSPGGAAFKREWWHGGKNRYLWSPGFFEERCIREWVSFDTAFEKGETNAWTAGITGSVLDTYDVCVREAERRHVGMDELPGFIREFVLPVYQRGRLGGVIIEAKASGISVMQTISASSDRWLAALITPYYPVDDKVTRYRNAAVWAKLGYLKFPFPCPECQWLYAYTQEIYDAPNARFLDWADCTAQLVDFLVPSVFEVAQAAREAANRIPR
jgi:phage terminase large subunit-like protein